MKSVHTMLYRSLALPFYTKHLGMFFVIFFLMFGVVESSQVISYHVSLIYGMFNSIVFFMAVMLAWTLYQLKCLHFILTTSEQSEYSFLRELATLSLRQTFIAFLALQFTLFLPVMVYTLFILAIAAKEGFSVHAVIIIAYQVLLCGLSAWIAVRRAHQHHVATAFKIPTLTVPFNRVLPFFYISHLLRQQKMGALISKLLSIAILYMVLQVMDILDDVRIPLLTLLFALVAHSSLVFELKRFEDIYLHWSRSLPKSIVSQFLNYLLVYFILLLPEMILLSGSVGRKIALVNWMMIYTFGVSFLTFLHIQLFKQKQNMESYTQFLLWFFLLVFFLILCKLGFALSVVLMAGAYVLLQKRFYQYEPTAAENLS